jgi:hypothetical protein
VANIPGGSFVLNTDGTYTYKSPPVTSDMALSFSMTPPPVPSEQTGPYVKFMIFVCRNGDQAVVFNESIGGGIKAFKYITYKKNPGSNDWFIICQGTVPDIPSDATTGGQFTNVVPFDSIKGTSWKIEMEEIVSGLKTSVTATVEEETLQAVALNDGRSIQLSIPGGFPGQVVANLYKLVPPSWNIRYLSGALFTSQTNVVVGPVGFPTKGSPIVVNVGFPDAVSYTAYVK